MVEAVRFTPNGSRVLAVAGTHTWTAWDWNTGRADRRNEAEVDFTYDRVAVGGPTEVVAGWGDLSHRANVLFSQPRPSGVVFMSAQDTGPLRFACLAVSADGKRAAGGVKGAVAARWDQQPAVLVWDTGTQKPRAVLLGHADWPMAIGFDPDGAGLVTAGKDGTVRHWRLP
jgi:WD40 repeat protein